MTNLFINENKEALTESSIDKIGCKLNKSYLITSNNRVYLWPKDSFYEYANEYKFQLKKNVQKMQKNMQKIMQNKMQKQCRKKCGPGNIAGITLAGRTIDVKESLWLQSNLDNIAGVTKENDCVGAAAR